MKSNTPQRIYIIGLPGAGKTYAGKALAEQLAIPFYDLDAFIEQQAGKSIATIFSEEGEDAFRKLEADALRNLSTQNTHFVLACGGGTPCYHSNMEYMNSQGQTIYLKETLAVIAERLAHEKAQRPLIAVLADDKIVPYLENLKQAREPYYLQAKLIVDNANQLAEKLNLLSNY